MVASELRPILGRLSGRVDTATAMGCLPVWLWFPLGAGRGYVIAGESGSLWGAGGGVLLGLLPMGWLIRAMRRRQGFR